MSELTIRLAAGAGGGAYVLRDGFGRALQSGPLAILVADAKKRGLAAVAVETGEDPLEPTREDLHNLRDAVLLWGSLDGGKNWPRAEHLQGLLAARIAARRGSDPSAGYAELELRAFAALLGGPPRAELEAAHEALRLYVGSARGPDAAAAGSMLSRVEALLKAGPL